MSGIGNFTGQTKMARELAVRKIGVERAASMTDDDIKEWIESNYKFFWGDICNFGRHEHDEETIALIPNDVFHEIVDSIEWLQR